MGAEEGLVSLSCISRAWERQEVNSLDNCIQSGDDLVGVQQGRESDTDGMNGKVEICRPG